MKKIIIAFVFFGGFISISHFFLTWLSDLFFNDMRDTLRSEVMHSIIIGCIIALLIVIVNRKSLRKGKS